MLRATQVYLALALLLGFTSSANGSGYIGVYADSTGLRCNFGPQQGLLLDFYILGSTFPSGIQGAEFRVTGLPAGSFVLSKTIHSGAIEIGDPLGLGVNIAFPTCDAGNPVLLYHYLVVLPAPPRITLNVEAHVTPSNANFPCPHIVMCDDPVFTKSCVSGGFATIVPPSEPVPSDGATDVGANTQLAWRRGSTPLCGLSHGTSTSVFFGTVPDPPFVANYGDPGGYAGPHDPGLLAPDTTYYWRVQQNSNGYISSPVWSFTTADFVVSVDTVTWDSVKQLYR